MKQYRSGHWLEVKYWEEGLTQRETADKFGVSPRTIREYMDQFDIPTREMRGENHPMHGRERTDEEKQKISSSLESRSFSEETRQRMSETQRGQELSKDVREKISESLEGLTRSKETRQKMSESTGGEQNPNWRGGYSRRYGPGWSITRQSIRKRDEVCQNCGHDGSDHRLEVHHIIPVRVFRSAEHLKIEDAHGEQNLVLLCKRCHGRAERGKIEFDAPIEMLFEGKNGNSLRAKSPHGDKAI